MIKSARFCILLILLGLLSACATPVDYAPTGAERMLDERVEILLADLLNDAAAQGPAAVVPGSAFQDEYFSRLEEIVCERLETRLRERNDIFTLNRQNWFELQAQRPLTFMNHPVAERRRLANAVIYQVDITADTVLDRVNCTITARGSDGRGLPGIVASGPLGFGQQSLAHTLFYTPANQNPYPEGLAERPFTSLDRLAYSLISELAESYNNGLKVGDRTVADREVKVLLYSKSAFGGGLDQVIEEALQQALITQSGFTCLLNRQDIGAALEQIDFYQWHSQIFKDIELPAFEVGTILLLADLSRPRRDGAFSLSLRALWHANPMEDERGGLILEDAAGTYVSGFAARAYFADDNLNYRYRRPDPGPRRHSSRPPAPPAPRKSWNGLSNDISLCFYDFTETLAARIYPVLNEAPGVTWLRRADELCDHDSDCLCYEIWYDGSEEEISAWLRNYLRTSKSLDFRIQSYGPGRLEVHFDGGFN